MKPCLRIKSITWTNCRVLLPIQSECWGGSGRRTGKFYLWPQYDCSRRGEGIQETGITSFLRATRKNYVHFPLFCSKRIFGQPATDIWDHMFNCTRSFDCTAAMCVKHWPSPISAPPPVELDRLKFIVRAQVSLNLSLEVNILHLNTRSMKKHHVGLPTLVCSLESPPAVISLSETWFTSDKNVLSFSIPWYYEFFSRCRMGRGCGVTIEVREVLVVVQMLQSELDECH